ncbi:MAG TPA: hypothetical protein VLQ67_09815 [Arachnia sp.]|nr:hypothetical protein [Arachnia sp.]
MSSSPTPTRAAWTAVSDDTTQPPAPWFGRLLGPAIAAALVVAGGLIGAGLGGATGSSESPTPAPSPKLTMDPPVQVGDLVRGDVTESGGPAPENQRIVRADYSDGVNKVIFVMTWPEEDAATYVADAGVEDAAEVGGGTLCGLSVDTSLPACGRVTEETGLLLLAVTEHATQDLAVLLTEFQTAVTP